ncbi:MAG TPA: hypothetical protein PLA16_02195, partial [Chitinophagales bacterium]|nr:hypothetical protein [Chitinophagales bacterium]
IGYLHFKTKYDMNKICPPFPKNKYLYDVTEKIYYDNDKEFNKELQDTIYFYTKRNKLFIHHKFHSGGAQYSQYGINVKGDTLYLVNKVCGDVWTEITQYEITYKVDIILKNKIITPSFSN